MDLEITITCCKILVEKLDAFVSSLEQEKSQELGVSDKLKIMFGNRDIEDMLKLVDRQTGSLNLLLTACNWYVMHTWNSFD